MEKTSDIKQLGPVVKALGYHNKLLKRIGRVEDQRLQVHRPHRLFDQCNSGHLPQVPLKANRSPCSPALQ